MIGAVTERTKRYDEYVVASPCTHKYSNNKGCCDAHSSARVATWRGGNSKRMAGSCAEKREEERKEEIG